MAALISSWRIFDPSAVALEEGRDSGFSRYYPSLLFQVSIMSAIASNEAAIVAQAQVTDAQHVFAATEKELGRGSIDVGKGPSVEMATAGQTDDVSEEDLLNLRRVSGKIPWPAYTIAFVELCERFSYYGTTIVCKSCHLPGPTAL